MYTQEKKRYHKVVLSEITAMRGGIPAYAEVNPNTPSSIARETKDHSWAAAMVANLMNDATRYV